MLTFMWQQVSQWTTQQGSSEVMKCWILKYESTNALKCYQNIKVPKYY